MVPVRGEHCKLALRCRAESGEEYEHNKFKVRFHYNMKKKYRVISHPHVFINRSTQSINWNMDFGNLVMAFTLKEARACSWRFRLA